MNSTSKKPENHSPIIESRGIRIGHKLQSLLIEWGMTQIWLSKKSGVSLKSVQRHLKDAPARKDICVLYARTFNVNTNYFDLLGVKSKVDNSILLKHLDWLKRDLQYIPYWPPISFLSRPSLKAVYVAPELLHQGNILTDGDLLRHHFAIISGPKKIGKSTYLQAIASSLARNVEPTIPIFISVDKLGNYIEKGEGMSLLSFISKQFENNFGVVAPPDEINKYFEQGAIVLMFDDFHHIKKFSFSIQEKIINLINSLPLNYPLTYSFISCIENSLFGVIHKLRHEYIQVKIQPLNTKQRIALINKLQSAYAEPELTNKLRQKLRSDPQLKSQLSTPLDFSVLLLSIINSWRRPEALPTPHLEP